MVLIFILVSWLAHILTECWCDCWFLTVDISFWKDTCNNIIAQTRSNWNVSFTAHDLLVFRDVWIIFIDICDWVLVWWKWNNKCLYFVIESEIIIFNVWWIWIRVSIKCAKLRRIRIVLSWYSLTMWNSWTICRYRYNYFIFIFIFMYINQNGKMQEWSNVSMVQ